MCIAFENIAVLPPSVMVEYLRGVWRGCSLGLGIFGIGIGNIWDWDWEYLGLGIFARGLERM